MSNPTVSAANASTGTEPLNAQPSSPKPPAHHLEPSSYIPPPLQSFTARTSAGVPFLPISLPFEHDKPKSSMPSAVEFEDVLTSNGHVGPARAEESDDSSFGEVVQGVQKAVDGGVVKVFRVVTGTKGKEDIYVVGLIVKEDRIVGMKASSVEG